MTKRDRSLLEDMLSYALDAIDLLGSLDANGLLADKRTQYAVVRAVEVIGEAASKVSAEMRGKLPALPWKAVVGMRNALIHAYPDLDLGTVVLVVRRDLPQLVADIRDALGDPTI